jgi:hypothetical protein
LQHALLVIFAEAAAWSEAGGTVEFRGHRKFFRIPWRAGRWRGAASRD